MSFETVTQVKTGATRSTRMDDLRQRFSSLGGTTAVSLRELTEVLADSIPDHFEELWEQSRDAPRGPIDVIDFFSGCGGMSAGFRAVNGLTPAYNPVLAVDIDAEANRTYAANLGLSPALADVKELAADLSRIDRLIAASGRDPANPLVVIGCAPCQGFSSHRNAAGAADARNDLFVDFARIATYLQPDFVVIENVPEICTDRYWPHIEAARRIFAAAGYQTNLAVHNMAEFGLPQERFRAVMLAARQPFDAPTGTRTADRFRTVRDAIAELPQVPAGVAHPSDPMHRSASHRQSTIDLIRCVPKDGGNRPAESGPASLAALGKRQGKAAYEDVYGRLAWDRPAITITHYARNPASGRFVHPEQDRGLTVREAALLQGFPRTYDFVGGFDAKFSQVGNAVPPIVAAHLATWILGQLLDPPAQGSGVGVERPLAKSFSRLIPGLKAESRRRAARAEVDS